MTANVKRRDSVAISGRTDLVNKMPINLQPNSGSPESMVSNALSSKNAFPLHL
jgi:hypothetical protein